MEPPSLFKRSVAPTPSKGAGEQALERAACGPHGIHTLRRMADS